MAPRTVPIGWRCPNRLKPVVEKLLPSLEDILHKKAGRYCSIPGMDGEALLQEARMAAMYAIATHDPERGRTLRTWVDLVVRNALLAIVNYELALKRAPRVEGEQPTRERRLAYIGGTEHVENHLGRQGEEQPSTVKEKQQAAWRLERVIQSLVPNRREVFLTKLRPSPELSILARNLHPNDPVVTDKMVAEHLGFSLEFVKETMRVVARRWRKSGRRYGCP